jgi:hypothetical protein
MKAQSAIEAIRPGNLATQYHDLGLDRLSDLALFAQAAAVIAHPKLDVDSFVLHAPLEILARYRLLPLVPPELRELARMRIVAAAVRYAAAGPAAEVVPVEPPQHPGAALLAAIDAGEADRAQALAAHFAQAFDAPAVTAALAQPVLTSLGAAVHGHLFFYLIGRVDEAAARAALPMLANFARNLAVDHDRKLGWTAPEAHPSGAGGLDAAAFEQALLASPLKPFSGFLHPIMHAAEEAQIPQSVVGRRIVGGLEPEAAEAGFACVCRAAALAMLQEPPRDAKYGWTHALNLPLGVWEIAAAVPDRAFALKAAATYFLGLRAARGQKRRLEAEPRLPKIGLPLAAALAKSPETAAACAWRAAPDQRDALFAELATQAAIRADAHLVKYVLSCLDAARRDPAPAYPAAAAHLTALWMAEESLADVRRALGVT